MTPITRFFFFLQKNRLLTGREQQDCCFHAFSVTACAFCQVRKEESRKILLRVKKLIMPLVEQSFLLVFHLHSPSPESVVLQCSQDLGSHATFSWTEPQGFHTFSSTNIEGIEKSNLFFILKEVTQLENPFKINQNILCIEKGKKCHLHADTRKAGKEAHNAAVQSPFFPRLFFRYSKSTQKSHNF